jgi:protein-tyrosine phosphatase
MTTAHPPADRALPVTGGHNLRDLGGYRTAEGATVKWRTLYRSGAIYRLSADDRAYMRQLGITAICDLRTPHERAHRPMDWHDGLDVHYYGGVPLESGARLETLIVTGTALQEQMLERMRGIYRKLPFEQAPSYRHLFSMLIAGKVPLLFNCSAGKDRTGVAAALILAALGVPRETIVHDYLLSNEAAEGLSAMMQERDTRYARLLAADPDALRPVLRAEISYLDMAFDEIDRAYGGLEAYLEQHLGVDAAGRAALREHLLD